MLNNDEPAAPAVENLITSISEVSSTPIVNDKNLFAPSPANNLIVNQVIEETNLRSSYVLNENHVKLKRPLSNPSLRIDNKKITRPSSALGIVQHTTDYPDLIDRQIRPIDEVTEEVEAEDESPSNSKENYVETIEKNCMNGESQMSNHLVHMMNSKENYVEPVEKKCINGESQRSNCLGQIINSLLGQEEQLIRLKGTNYLENVQRYAANLIPLDCCFIVEKCRPFNCDTVFMSYFREQYLSPILIHLNGGPPLNADFGRDAYTSIYSMLNFSAANCKEGCKTMVSDTPSIYRLIKESTQMHFIERHFQTANFRKTSPKAALTAKLTSGGSGKVSIVPILESIEEEFNRLSSLRQGLANSILRHCFLLICSPISFDGIEKVRQPGDIIDRLNKLDIKLTIFSPIKDNSYSVLYEMINRTHIDPIFDKTWQTIFLSVPLMTLHTNDATSAIIGPVASAHHAEEQAKLAMRSTFEVQQHQQTSPKFNISTGSIGCPGSIGQDQTMFNGSPITISQPQSLQQHQSPGNNNGRNPGSASAYYNFLSGPQSVPSVTNTLNFQSNPNNCNNQTPTTQSPYSSHNQINQIPNSPYGNVGNQPVVNTANLGPQQQYSNPPSNIRPTTPNTSQSNYQPGKHQMFSQSNSSNSLNPPLQTASMNSSPPSVGTPNNNQTNGRKSLQDPGSVHSNSGNENPQSWGRPCTPNQGRANTPIQNISAISDQSPIQASVPSPSFNFVPNQNPNNFIPNSPSGPQQFNQQNGTRPSQQLAMNPKIYRANIPSQHGHIQRQPLDSLGMLISGNGMPSQQQMHPSMGTPSGYAPQQTTSISNTNTPILNSLPHHQQHHRPQPINSGNHHMIPQPPQNQNNNPNSGTMQYTNNPNGQNFPLGSSQQMPTQPNQMAKQSFGFIPNPINNVEDMNRYGNQNNYNQTQQMMNQQQHQLQFQQQQQQQQRQNLKSDMSVRMNQKMTQKQFQIQQQQQQQQQMLMSQTNSMVNDPSMMGMTKNSQMKGQTRPNMMPGNQQQPPMQMMNQGIRNQRIMNPNIESNKNMDPFDMNSMSATNAGGLASNFQPNNGSLTSNNLQFNPMMSNQQKYQLQNMMNPMDGIGPQFPDDRQKFSQQPQQQQMVRSMNPQRMQMKMPQQQMQIPSGPAAGYPNNQGFMMNPNQQQTHQPQLLQHFPQQNQQRPRF